MAIKESTLDVEAERKGDPHEAGQGPLERDLARLAEAMAELRKVVSRSTPYYLRIKALLGRRASADLRKGR